MSPRLRSIALLVLTLLAAAVVAGPAGAHKGSPPVPGAATVEAVGPRSATVKALLDAKGSRTRYHFEYGVVPAYDMATAEATLDAGKATVFGALNDLEPGQRYEVRLVAVNDDGTATGASAQFQTPAAATPSEEPAPDADAPADEERPSAGAPAPALGEAIVAAPTKGEVKVRAPGATSFTVLEGGARIPVGSRVDARAGAVAVTSEIDSYGAAQTGEFGGGIFVVRQAPDGDGVTSIHLRGGSFRGCRRLTRAASARTLAQTASKHRRRVRRLWGSDDHGRFRTHGRDSVATVRGTRWVTVDRCDGTLTRVTRGAVDVRARRGGRTVTVRAGDSLFTRHRR